MNNYIKIIKEIVYSFFSIIFMFFLNSLNKELIDNGLDLRTYDLLIYKNFLPVKYFIFTLILIILGVIFILYNINYIKNYELELDEILYLVVGCIIDVIIILILIHLTNHPIFKEISIAVSTFLAIGYGFLES
ncbi:hypothetical protein [uncultured Parvimonas sp.]|uniref:hypothetical protein n=2 Tax=uncultured Parvimonas sp. TaxID=747372 RepID=UPI002591BFC6|nr:hypothetical protein [uncultured Parvimonas sp.]